MTRFDPMPASLESWALEFLESSPDPFVAFDGAGQVLFVNSAAEALFERSRSELIERPIQQLFPTLDPVAASDTRLRLDACRPDGRSFPVNLALTRVERDGSPWCVTRVEPIGPVLPQPRGDALREEFLLTLSHELRSPLQAILSWAQLLRSGPCDEAQTTRGLEAIERNIHWQVEVIEDMLELSQIMSGDLEIELQPVRMSDVLEEEAAEIFERARLQRIRLTRTIDPDESPVLADRAWLGRTLRTLLANSLKFTGEGGTIDIDLRRRGAFLQLTIVDANPAGLADSPRPHDAFRHGNPSATRHFDALGVALVKVQRLVELQGGAVDAESAGYGKGVRLAISLPIASA